MRIFSIILVLLLSISIYAEKIKIKFASLAPRGSTWLNVMEEYNQIIQEESKEKISFRIYPGGVSGNEIDVLRKIRMGQLHAGGFTGVALGEILPEVRIFDAPFLLNSNEEADLIQQLLFDDFSAKFEKKNFILLGWAEVGFVYIFTKKPVTSIQDLNGIKMWMWEGDPVAKATFDALGFKPIPMNVTDVLTALQTGMIDGLYVSPLGAVSLQWYTKINYMLELPLANAIGAILISKDIWQTLTPEEQRMMRGYGRTYMQKLIKLSREDNMKSIEEMKKKGLKLTTIKNPKDLETIRLAGEKARTKMAQSLYSPELLKKVEDTLNEFRAKNNSPN